MERRQLTIFGAIFVAIIVILTVIYFAFFRQGYAVLYEDMREADAAEIVAVLDKQGIDYRLEDSGHRILVPGDEVGRARVLVAGSGVAMGGTVGFELFNESDMGLTEFAQKVNYQRALQGELARTIMGMEGIVFARVHLSLPEKTLFRANQAGPKAAVTLQTQGDITPDPARVLGIQQLVSAAVTDLPAREVAVLDHRGRLLSAISTEGQDSPGPLDEKSALQEYYSARARSVAEKLIPGVPFDVRVLAIATNNEPVPDVNESGLPGDSAAPAGAPPAAPDTPKSNRNFSLRIAFRTEMKLTDEDQQLLRDAIIQATALSLDQGDALRFETGPLEQYGPTPAPQANQADAPRLPPIAAQSDTGDLVSKLLGSTWFLAMLGVIVFFVLILLRRRSRLSPEEQQSFADLLGENLAVEGGPSSER